MDFLVENIYEFIESIKSALSTVDTDFTTFLNKNVFLDNSIIGLNITFNELLLYIGTIFFIFFFIFLFVKIISKLIFLFK